MIAITRKVTLYGIYTHHNYVCKIRPIPCAILRARAFFRYHSLAKDRVIFANAAGDMRPFSTARPSMNIASPSALSSATTLYN